MSERYKILYEDEKSGARVGELKTLHGTIKTPFFMPVATKGSVKYLNSIMLKEIGTDAIISNSLILSWRPGISLIEKAGGIHKLINWNGVIFTDSGGFQSLDNVMTVKTTNDAAFFKSPFDGKIYEISPEKAMEFQLAIGSDAAMCLDDVPKHNDTEREIRSKTLRTHSWARRCKEHHDKIDPKHNQLLFGISQGGLNIDIRKKSIEFLDSLGFDGIAQGGLAIGEPIESMYDMLKKSAEFLPKNKPHYLMGVGNPTDILEAVSLGYDCFDSTFPTRNARHETLFTMKGRLRLDQKRHEEDLSPLEEDCGCFTCKNYTKAFVHHMIKNNEGVGKQLATIHNIYFMQRFIEEIRLSIKENRLTKLKNDMQEMMRK